MKQITRESAVERAILIAMCSRDVVSCIEVFELYASVVRVLEQNSKGYEILGLPQLTKDNLGRSITPMWCFVEALSSPFSKDTLRKAIADALRLARKELSDDELGR